MNDDLFGTYLRSMIYPGLKKARQRHIRDGFHGLLEIAAGDLFSPIVLGVDSQDPRAFVIGKASAGIAGLSPVVEAERAILTVSLQLLITFVRGFDFAGVAF